MTDSRADRGARRTVELPPANAWAVPVVIGILAPVIVAKSAHASIEVLLGASALGIVAGVLGAIVVRTARKDLAALARDPKAPDADIVSREARAAREEIAEAGRRADAAVAAETRALAAITDVASARAALLVAMSHDLRSPLNSVLGFSELLLTSERSLDVAQREACARIHRRGAFVLHRLGEILDGARIAAGKLEVHRRLASTADVVSIAEGKIREATDPAVHSVASEIETGLPAIDVDTDRVAQAVVALALHGAERCKRASLRLSATTNHGPPGPRAQVRIDVTFSAGSLRERDREHLLGAFRVEESTAEDARGTAVLSLGLALVKDIARLHGGRVWSEPTDDGGTRFILALPHAGPSATRSGARS